MEETFVPFRGIKNDLEGRLLCYKQDWTGGFRAGFRILAPTTYIFFASAIPVISFGEQLDSNTNGAITAVQTRASTEICGAIHSIIEGQPLLILGVAEPTVLMYTFMFNFAKDKQDLGEKLFLPWTGWVCLWTALLLFLLAVLGACSIINRFTRVAGKLFGMLIAMLFMQQAIKGVVDEFRIPQREDPNAAVLSLSWRFGNGMFALVLSFGFLLTALKSRKARSWRYVTGWLRGSIADYGVPLVVPVWTAVSYIPRSSLVEKSRQKPKESLSVLSDVSILHYVSSAALVSRRSTIVLRCPRVNNAPKSSRQTTAHLLLPAAGILQNISFIIKIREAATSDSKSQQKLKFLSVPNMDLEAGYFEKETTKALLLCPRNSYDYLCNDLKLNVDDTEATNYYVCNDMFQDGYFSDKHSASLRTSQLDRCSCGKLMDQGVSFEVLNDGVFVQGRMFMALLKDLGIKEVDSFEEETINLGVKEILDLLQLSFISMTPLTDVLLKGVNHTSAARKMEQEETHYILKSEDVLSSDNKKITVKLNIRKSNNTVLYAEAGEDFVDFLFRLLTIHLGSVLRLLVQTPKLGCLTNLHKSVESSCSP
ncbi:hypothetical protein GIB67_027551 [Kingdonia uniflora]|uniref:Bicarbonate transporter-like transmembrane domain-containing protein n=1 Tax=Kingdonia uniflora TaxID=39325 RepID=A0A7J7NL07_9MAGN|nr:hypothetical protein GIB67_027551 [Kingdonia uniflora]